MVDGVLFVCAFLEKYNTISGYKQLIWISKQLWGSETYSSYLDKQYRTSYLIRMRIYTIFQFSKIHFSSYFPTLSFTPFPSLSSTSKTHSLTVSFSFFSFSFFFSQSCSSVLWESELKFRVQMRLSFSQRIWPAKIMWMRGPDRGKWSFRMLTFNLELEDKTRLQTIDLFCPENANSWIEA